MSSYSLAAPVGLTIDITHLAQKLNKMLKLLDALDCSEKHGETSLIRQSDTCMWLPGTDAYRSWKEGMVSFLWLQGKGILCDDPKVFVAYTNLITAGAGKSVLACVYAPY
jgi:hypothetical protein